jgi:aminopeptidase N
MKTPVRTFAITALLLVGALPAQSTEPERDYHSFANPEHVRVRHVDLDLTVSFEERVIRGTAVLTVGRTSEDTDQPLTLDTRGLAITSVETSADGLTFNSTAFELGPTDPVLGRSLTVQLPAVVRAVRIRYTTSPQATALQWLSPAQTTDKKHPFLFTQSQAIEARSWIPLQDSPGVRITYAARVRTPNELVAVMSAGGNPTDAPTGDYHFEMKEPIPPYLIALAVGDLRFRKLGLRAGVYAEPSVVDRAVAEFADIEDMIQACERLYGPYRWGRYDVLVMPPSFPYGGMENPRLTFLSPTVLAGDRSLVAVLAHELAHSWSGNLVSNATWRDFWLNEGFTVYIERRIMEAVYGKERADAEALLGRRSLEEELAVLPKSDQILHIDLKGRPPIDGLTDVPYEKGSLFLQHLETVYGRETFDAFLRGYFNHFAFRSITTTEFANYLDKHLLAGDAAKAKHAQVSAWLYEPGLPDDAPTPSAKKLAAAEQHAQQFVTGKIKAADIPGQYWSAVEWLHFLASLPADLGLMRMAELDTKFHLSQSQNSEVLFRWLLLSIRTGYPGADDRLKEFLTSQGRRKFLKPLYEELAKTSDGRTRALAIYSKARPTYHPVAVETIDAILDWQKQR